MKKTLFIHFLALLAEISLVAMNNNPSLKETQSSFRPFMSLVKTTPLDIEAIQKALTNPSLSEEINFMEKGTNKTPLHYLVAHPQASKEIVEALITANQKKTENIEFPIPFIRMLFELETILL